MFYGANRTGRFSGRLIQMQNLPQNHLPDLAEARALVRQGNLEAVKMLYGDVPDTLSQLIRTAFIPREGARFYVADFSAIEARVLSWIAGEEWRMEVLKEYATLASTEVKKAVRKSAKTVKDQISSNAPSRTGAYKESWVATKQSESSQSLQMVVHSKNRYQLAHLLEKGHAKRGGGRVAARPHIAPAEQAGIELLQSLIEKALK